MKKLTLLVIVAFSFMSCDKDDLYEKETDVTAKAVVGTWQLYKDESRMSVINEWTGSEWTYVDQWFQTTRDNSVIILEFKDDGTFIDRYADVEVAAGTWGILEDGSYYFDYVQEAANTNDNLIGRRNITVYCENTFSSITEGNEQHIYYYKKINTSECSDQINYMVE